MGLRVQNLFKSYRRQDTEIPVLKGLNLSIERGQSLAVVGSSGVGKSTLLHCLGLLDAADRGEIFLDSDLVDSIHGSRVETRRKKIGFVFQFHYLMAELSALENVSIPLLLDHQAPEEAETQAKYWLERVGLKDRMSHRPAELSGGEQQRVSIARALVHKPTLILADEPTGNLDPETARKVFDVLKEQCKSLNSILIMATHNLELAGNLDRKQTLQKGVLI